MNFITLIRGEIKRFKANRQNRRIKNIPHTGYQYAPTSPLKENSHWYSTKNWFDPTKSFTSLLSFWVPTSFIFILTGTLFTQIIITKQLEFYPQGDISAWADTFKIPLGILALLIPILGFLNANHKSEQTRESLSISKKQNIFANYYKHIEEFEKHAKGIEERHKEYKLKVSRRRLHSLMFPAAKDGHFGISLQWILDQKKFGDDLTIFLATKIRNHFDSKNFYTPNYPSDYLADLLRNYQGLISHGHLKFDGKLPVELLNENESYVLSLSKEEIRSLNEVYCSFLILDELTLFDGDFISPVESRTSQIRQYLNFLSVDTDHDQLNKFGIILSS